MNRNNGYFLFLIILFLTTGCFADDKDGFPNVPGKEKALARLVGEACVWNHFWFDDWGKDFDKNFRIGQKETVGVCFKDNKIKDQQGYQVFFDKLPSDLYFYKQSNWWYTPGITWDYKDERVSKKLNEKDYLDSKTQQSAGIKEFSVRFEKRVLDVLNFGPFDKAKQQFVKDVFLNRVFKGDGIESFKKVIERNGGKGILIKVGNFNFDYPIFYYYVEGLDYEKGVPYLGYVYFDTQTHEPFYDELIGSESQPVAKKYKTAIKRIDQNGMTFRYLNGKFLDN